MKKLFTVLTVSMVIGLSGFMMAGACDEASALCGDCGTIENGDATISGMAQLDGIFKAVGTLKATTGSINANFDGQVRAMAEGVFGINADGKNTAELVGEIETAFGLWINAAVDGGVKIVYVAPKCSANVNVAVSAQAQCEAKADCNVSVECDPGQMSFECSGKCEGSCSGKCEVPTCTVTVTPGQANCSGTCQGSCTVAVDGSAGCEGTCQGTCDGECSAFDGEGNCNGSCSGNCDGSCSAQASATAACEGECHGECKIEGPEAEASCDGEIGCSGSCDASCSGGCEGEIKAPKCEGNAECSASAECEAQASAQASASLECTPPSLSIDFAFKAGVDAAAQATFMVKLEKFKVGMIGILQGMANLRALVDAEAAAEIGIEPPVVTIKASVDAFISALAAGEIELEAPALLPCAITAFEDSAKVLTSLPGEMAATIDLQLKMAALLKL